MVICPCGDLRCMLPLGVAINAAGKLRLIWYGRHVNRHLPKRKFRMETLQREGHALFERSAWDGTVDLSSAYHHVPMAPDATAYLGVEWKGTFYKFEVLPFSLSHAPWLFTKMMGHCARFLRSPGIRSHRPFAFRLRACLTSLCLAASIFCNTSTTSFSVPDRPATPSGPRSASSQSSAASAGWCIPPSAPAHPKPCRHSVPSACGSTLQHRRSRSPPTWLVASSMPLPPSPRAPCSYPFAQSPG